MVTRPYYELREVAEQTLRIVADGRSFLEQFPERGDPAELRRLESLAERLQEAIGDLGDGKPVDREAAWRLLPKLEQELCRWVYDAPFFVNVSTATSQGPGLSRDYPPTLLDQLNEARKELAVLEPASLEVRLQAPREPSLSALDQQGL